jgi:hypothetical protein
MEISQVLTQMIKILGVMTKVAKLLKLPKCSL